MICDPDRDSGKISSCGKILAKDFGFWNLRKKSNPKNPEFWIQEKSRDIEIFSFGFFLRLKFLG